MNNHIRLLFCGILFLAGCATNQLQLTIYSDPPGATIYQGEKVLGYAPLNVRVNEPPEDQKSTIIKVSDAKAVWASGVSRSLKYINLDRSKFTRFQFTFVRPDVPGREIDVNFALQLERNRILQQQAQAQQDQAFWQMYSTTLNQYRQSYVPAYTTGFKSFNCTSRRVGSYVYTDCY